MKWQLVVFDCDGTLVDCQHAIVKSISKAFKSHGLAKPKPELIRRRIGASMPDVMKAILPPGAKVDMAKLGASYRETFIQTRMLNPNYYDPLYPGCIEALDALQAQGVTLGIVAGKSREGLEEGCGRHGILERFATIQPEESGAPKPSPERLERAMADVGAKPETTVMIGDSIMDIRMAKAAGAYSIGVTWGFNLPNELHGAGANAVIDSYGRLLPTLEELG